uniref:Ubiquitin carboxyl-terminal hydrolase n=1 Tax=Hadrurus spadix TaxID=141984 RepID=A0A1W7RAQ2_9SCOR
MSSRWLPLESNPDVMNKFLQNVGVPSQWNMVDVVDLSDDMLQNVPQPVAAVLLLFPGGDKYEEFIQQQEEEIQGQTVNDDVYFMKQTIKNACGTIALIHAVANNAEKISLDNDSVLQQFIEETKGLSSEERGQALEQNESISAAHEACAQEGQTQVPGSDEDVALHFVTFVQFDGTLYELDGRKSVPINHGSTSDDSFLQDACRVCKEFMERDPDNVNFTVVALTASADM